MKYAILVAVLSVAVFCRYGGEKQQDFKLCLADCLVDESCDQRLFVRGQPLVLRWLAWDCDAECKYRCMWQTEEKNKETGRPAIQYYGRWPFKRILWMQEPGSTIFSAVNLAAHVYGFNQIYLRTVGSRAGDWFLHRVLATHYVFSINAWIWSVIYHIRDVQSTRWLDIFSAIASIFVLAIITIVRVFNIRQKSKQLLVSLPFCLYFIRHVYYMVVVRFDHGWNMKVAIAAALIFKVLFFSWSAVNLVYGRNPAAKYSMIGLICGVLAALLELFDFPPIASIFDAHAAWHLATPAIFLCWYRFFAIDATHDLGLDAGLYEKKRMFNKY